MSFSRCVQRQVPLRSAVASLQQSRPHPCRGAVFLRDSHVSVDKVVVVALVVRVPQLPFVRRQS